MTSRELQYPKVMELGQLEAVNDYVISRLGTPVFFVTPNLPRPKTHTAGGRLYEVVTGLYIIYHDYGMRLLKCYLEFCKNESIYQNGSSKFVFSHYYSVNTLRGGMCHGSIPGGFQAGELIRKMDFYVAEPEDKVWPDFMRSLTEQQCTDTVNKLSSSSNRLMDYIKSCADQIAADGENLRKWRQTLVDTALNPTAPQYGNSEKKLYFDERVVRDVEKSVNKGAELKPHQNALKEWLGQLEPKILSGEIAGSEELYHTLLKRLEELYDSTSIQAHYSSAALLLGDFF